MYEATVINGRGDCKTCVLTAENVLRVLSKRDLKIIDENQNFKISTLKTGNKYILCKFDYLRFIIFQTEVYIFNSKQSNSQIAITRFLEQFTNKIREERDEKTDGHERNGLLISNTLKLSQQSNEAQGIEGTTSDEKGVSAFSFMALEICLKHLDELYDTKVEEIRPDIVRIMEHLENDNTGDDATKSMLTKLQHRFLNLQYKIKDMDDLFQDINSWDENEITEFNISGSEGYNQKYLDLFEGYGKYFEETRDEIDKMGKTIEFAMRIIDMNILMKRNKYAKYDIHLQMMTLSLTAGTFISSLFGMNLNSHLEKNDIAFYITSVIIISLFLTLFAISRCLFLKYTK